MSARYWVLCSDELMAQPDLRWPSFIRPVRASEELPPDNWSRWWLFEDDDAPAELDGKRVEVTFTSTWLPAISSEPVIGVERWLAP